MPRRKRRNAALCVQRKGYWRTKKIIVTEDNEGNRNKVDRIENINCVNDDNGTSIGRKDDETKTVSIDNTDEKNVVPFDESKQKEYFKKQRLTARRWSIFDLFVNKYGGLEPEDGNYYKLWSGRNGSNAKIQKDLGIKK